MKNRLYFIYYFLIIAAGVKAQAISGMLIDEQNKPLPYANVILQTADSIYLAGTTTGLDGKFELALHEKAKLIKFSYVGYNSVIQEISDNELGAIQLLPDALLLGEVVVKGYLPKTQAKGDAMVTTVSGTVLEKAGTAENLLDKIPNVTAQNGAVTVFGRGAPEIYINGRKLRNQQELDQLSSDNIKSVEVVSNPGARYNYVRMPEFIWLVNQFAQTYCGDLLHEDLHSVITMKEPETHHRSNFYYNGKVKKWSIDFNADGLWSDTKNTQVAKEDIIDSMTDNADRSVTTINTTMV